MKKNVIVKRLVVAVFIMMVLLCAPLYKIYSAFFENYNTFPTNMYLNLFESLSLETEKLSFLKRTPKI